MGQGYAQFGMRAILIEGFNKLGLERVYWCVNEHNARAVSFYEKNKYRECVYVPKELQDYYKGMSSLKWYFVSKTDNI